MGKFATDFGFAAGIVFASAQQPGRADHRHPPADRGRRDARAGPAGPAANSRGHHGHPRRGRSGAIAVAAYASNAAICLSAVCVAVAGSYSAIPHFWRLPSPHLSGPATASGIDLIPCGANLSALAGRYVTGFAVDHTGNYR